MIYSVGHSTHEAEAFFGLLEGLTGTLVDIRSHPTSRWPQFQQGNLRQECEQQAVEYVWEPRLGGWTEAHERYANEMASHGVDLSGYAKGAFPKQIISQKTQAKQGWTNRGLYDYSWFTTLPEFAQAVADLEAHDSCAIMCAEALWWRCHRSLVADYIVAHGGDVAHIKSVRPKRPTTPRYTMHSEHLGDRLHRYHGGIAWAQGQTQMAVTA